MADGLKLNLKDAWLLKNAEGTFHEIKGKNSSGASFSWRSPIVITMDVSISQTVSNLAIFSSNNSGQNADLRLDWGDGTTVIITTHQGFSFHSHTYSTSTGTYDLTVTPLSQFSNCYVASDLASIVEVKSFGSLVVENGVSQSSRFGGINLVSVPKSISPKIKSLFSVLNASSLNNTFNDVNVTYWDVSNVNNFIGVFYDRVAFNQDISGWDMSAATTINGMFTNAQVFNQDISTWDTSNVQDMERSFEDAFLFNQNISTWNTSKVTKPSWMFLGASSFNQNISTWDTSSFTTMNGMFQSASAFNQDLGSWSINNVTAMTGLFDSSGMSTENYSRTLIGWANSHYAGNAKNNVSLGATSITYNSTAYTTGNQFNDGVSARAYLVGTAGWIITDGGQV